MIRKHFRLKKIALGLAFAAVVVPSAQATVLLDGHPAPVSYTAVAHQPIASEVSVQSPVSQLQVEGLRWQAMANAYQAQSPVKSENSFGVPGPSLAGATGPQIVAAAAGTTSNGFNWGDAYSWSSWRTADSRREAIIAASRLDPQRRLTVEPGTETGSPASKAAIRATVRLCTSSGPSASRSVRMLAYMRARPESVVTPAPPHA